MKKYIYITYAFSSLALGSCIRQDETPITIPPLEGAVVDVAVGGPNQPNQVWVNLSDNTQKATSREAWDLAFYSGDENRVILNYSLIMAVGKIENTYDIDKVTPEMVAELKNKVQVANFDPENSKYVDNPSGQYLTQTTGIEEIKTDENQNNVYLLNMGNAIYQGTTAKGSPYPRGESRGWKKIKITATNGGYKIQYANLEDTTHKEAFIKKDSEYHFNFFSIINEKVTDVQPKKNDWDLCFTVFTNLVDNGGASTSYIYSDMVISNIFSKTAIYEVKTNTLTADEEYKNFKRENIDETKFDTTDQRTIGSSWRDAQRRIVFPNKFYVIKDAEGFYYKLKFIKLMNDDGYRGYPQFQYEPL